MGISSLRARYQFVHYTGIQSKVLYKTLCISFTMGNECKGITDVSDCIYKRECKWDFDNDKCIENGSGRQDDLSSFKLPIFDSLDVGVLRAAVDAEYKWDKN